MRALGVLFDLIDEKTQNIIDKYWKGEDLKTVIESEKAEYEAEILLRIIKKHKRGEGN